MSSRREPRRGSPSGGGDGGDDAAAAGSDSPASSAAKNFAFIRFIIQQLLPKQPIWVQGIVLFAFVFLFIYFAVFTLQSSVVVPIEAKVSLTAAEVAKKRRDGILIDDKAYNPPPAGYAVTYDDFNYALNADGKTRIDLPVWQYSWLLVRRSLTVDVVTPERSHSSRSVEFSGLANGHIVFDPPVDRGIGPAVDRSIEGGEKLAGAGSGLNVVDPAHADIPLDGRLYVQAVTVPPSVPSVTVTATLETGGASEPLVTLATDLSSQSEMPILLISGASVVQDYRTFFHLPRPELSGGARVWLRGGGGYFQSGYSESFTMPDAPPRLGVPLTVTGSNRSTIVVQLAYPIDVVFFQRLKTLEATETLIPQMARLGYAPRINTNAAASPGDFNVLYSGEGVPMPALQDVLGVMAKSKITLRSVQPQLKLRNGMQNQIQIGSSASLECLPAISAQTLTDLVQASSSAAFGAIIDGLPKPGSC